MSDPKPNHEDVKPAEGAQASDGACETTAFLEPRGVAELSKEHQQIRKWLEDAIIANRGDVYSGKRDETRFKKPIQMDAKFYNSDPSETARATMHNISCTGIAFWVRDEAELGTVVQLRDCDPLARISWVSGTITHCRRGLRGFVVGARFEAPLTDPPPGWEELLGVTDSADVDDPADAACECEPDGECEATSPCASADCSETAGEGNPVDGREAMDDDPDEQDKGNEEDKGHGDRGILSWFGLG